MCPVISVVIPCYNQGRFLGEAIESVLGQTYPHVEVVIVDDGSTDDTPVVAGRYDDRLIYVRKVNAGVNAARNTGILRATGEFVLFLDADDFLRSDALERHMAVALAAPTGVVFYGGWQEVGEQGQFISELSAPDLSPDPFQALVQQNLPVHCFTVRRDAFAEVGLFNTRLKRNEEYDLWLRLAAAGCRFVAVPGIGAVYRRHAGGITADKLAMHMSTLALFERHLVLNRGNPARVQVLRDGLRLSRLHVARCLVREALGDSGGEAPKAPWRRGALVLRALCRDPRVFFYDFPGVSRLYWALSFRLQRWRSRPRVNSE